MSLDHDDSGPLIDALDRWFAILRKRLGVPVPLKPATDDQLERLAEFWGFDLPPDVIALFRYTNGIWKNDEELLWKSFLPDYAEFTPLPPTARQWEYGAPRRPGENWIRPNSFTQEIEGMEIEGTGYDDVPGQDWEKNVPLFYFGSGDQISVLAAPSHYQAVAVFNFNGMYWVTRRLADLFENAIALEERGLLKWSGSLAKIREKGASAVASVPWHPDHYYNYRGWIWEPTTEAN